jgi:hypothetical protein
MDWNAVVHPRLSVPVLPPPEQVVLVYVANLRQFAVGQQRAGVWTVQPPLAGAVTHWAVLTPPGASAPSSATASVKRELVPARPAGALKPPYNR